MRLLVIDNYDSFTYNLVHFLGELGAEPIVRRNDKVTLDDVLFAGEGKDVKDSQKLTVAAEIIAQAKGEKVIVFKKRRRHNYRRKNGHRQNHTILRIVSIGA